MFHRKSVLVGLILIGAVCGLIAADNGSSSIFESFRWRNIGPANMGGRISDIQALENDFRFVVVGSASGGVWKTTNAGTTWDPIFDRYGSASIGSVGLFQENSLIIWVGTGESNVRNSVGWGDGIYKSTDGGKTFENMGLKDSHHIARIVTHPTDPGVVYAAAQGHLWGHTGQRGLFKTTDGGKTWVKLGGGLPDDGKTGCTDIRMDPRNPDVLFAAFWERIRFPYKFVSGGPNGGLFKSTDGGQSWKRLTNGLPEGDTGRIGLAVYRKNPDVVMAIVEHGFQLRRGSKDYDDMTRLGSGIYRSEDGGETWAFVNRYNNRPFYYSHIYINPLNDQRVYAMGTTAQVSEDGGRTFETGMPGIAGDFHCMWLDPYNEDRYYVANDKGISLTHDQGAHFNFFDNFCISQIYAVSTDRRDPYFVYVGLQDNGIWGGPSNSLDYNGILNDHWFKFHSGDGFYTAVDPEDWTTVYSESQGGRIRRNHAVYRQRSVQITPSSGNTVNWKDRISKSTDPKRPVVRRNWNTPFLISHFNPHTLYYGANHVFKSVDRGEHWVVVSPDLTTAHPEKILQESGGLTRDVTGAEVHCTIITLSESPLRPGLLWAGTDDGLVQVTKDDGLNWTNVRPTGVPEDLWVSRVETSHFDEGTCYVTFDGHRSDVFRPFVFKTQDFGQTWVEITGNIPDGFCVYVIREDLINPNLLFVGTEFGVLASIDGGKSWASLMNGLPVVAVHDLLIHPDRGDLIAGTHGRGVWIMDDITPLQQMANVPAEAGAFLFQPRGITLWEGISRGATRGHQLFVGQNPPTVSQAPPSNSPNPLQHYVILHSYLREAPKGESLIRISAIDGEEEVFIPLEKKEGIQRHLWDLRFSPSERQLKLYRQSLGRLLDHILENANVDEKKEIQKLKKELNQAEPAHELNRIRSGIYENFESLITERRLMVMPMMGPPAGPGTYFIELSLNGSLRGRVILSVR